MTVLHLMQCTNLGGMEQAAFRVMDVLREEGVRFRIATPRPFGPGVGRVRAVDPKARDFAYRGKFGWRDFPAFRRHVRTLARDCTHIWVTGTSAAALAALGGIDRPKVLAHHYHHREGPLSGLKWRLFYDLLCRDLDAVTYPTRFTRDEAVEIAPWLAGRAQVSPNGVAVHFEGDSDCLARRRAARQRLGLPADALVVGNGGWLIRRKRLDVFLSTAARIHRVRPDSRFVICGDGPLRNELEDHAATLGLADAVKFVGWVADMSDYYRAFDVLLFNSDYDALGLTPLEAAGFGACVVASVRYGGLSEFITPGVNGFLFPTHDTERLAAAVLSIADRPALASKLRNNARSTLESRFSPEIAARFFRDFFSNGPGFSRGAGGSRPAGGAVA